MSLKNEQSLYLKQHQDQPIQWKAWNQKTWQEIKNNNKCVFISIGYSACHWCHVMAHESFENEEVATYMNQNYHSIKVDREEFPDVDHYYQRAANYMGKNGGWPLSVFLAPDLTILFIGTYFPLEDRPNLPSFLTLAKEIHSRFHDPSQTSTMMEQGKKLMEQLTKRHKSPEIPKYEGHFPSANQILQALDKYFDKNCGGYGKAPKFPQFSFYEAMVEQILEGVVEKEKGEQIIQSIEWMNMGGIYDHAKGGIHRYSTDEKWLVPHFEKMLYDQAGFLRLLSKTSLIYPSPLIIDSILQTLDYLQTEMMSESGYFFAAQDADSEGKEGLYFTFLKEEFEDALNYFDDLDETILDTKSEDIANWFQITEAGNFENSLNVISLNPKLKEEFFKPENWEIVRKVKQALLQERKKRVPPTTDQKGLCSWNFLLISALIDVVKYARIDQVKSKAHELIKKSLKSIHANFVTINNNELHLIHSTTLKADEKNSPTYLEDYVFFSEAYFKLHQITGEKSYLEFARLGLKSIEKYFFQNGEIYERKFNSESVIGNPIASFHDQSYCSAVSTCLALVAKMELLSLDYANETTNGTWTKIKELIREQGLYNPLAMGEALKYLIYPRHAFKRIDVPNNWKDLNPFLDLMPHFSSRFIINYDTDRVENQKWQICRFDACEIDGVGIDTFVQTLFKKEVKP